MRPRRSALLAALALMGLTLAGSPARAEFVRSGTATFTFVVGQGTAVPAGLAAWTGGHGDIAVEYDAAADEIEFHYHFDASSIIDGSPLGANPPGGFEYDPADIALVVDRAGAALPTNNPIRTWLGQPATGAAQYWELPSTGSAAAAAGVPYLGFETEELPPGVLDGAWSIAFEGDNPGHMAIWMPTSFGPELLASTVSGLQGTFSALLNSHEHYVVGFSAPGVYRINLTFTATLPGDPPPGGDPGVVPEPSGLLITAIGLVGLAGAAARRRARRAD